MKKKLLAMFLIAMITIVMVATPVFAQNKNEQNILDPGTPPKGVAVKIFVHYAKNAAKLGLVTSQATNETYSYSGYHWLDPNGSTDQGIPYYLNLNYPTKKSPGLTKTAATNTIDTSFNTWVAAQNPGSNLLYKDMGSTTASGGKYDGKNIISWKALSRGTIAVTYVWYIPTTKAILEFDMLYNTVYSWTVTEPTIPNGTYDPLNNLFGDPNNSGISNTFDLQNIVTHEAGHTLMLNDLYDAGAVSLTMYGYSDYRELSKDTLQKGDYLGLNYIY